MALHTEADVVRTLEEGTYHLDDIYRLVEDRVDVTRDHGLDEVHPGDRRWRRRVRSALQQLRARGAGESIARSTWAIRGSRSRPERLLLIVAGGTPREFELRLQNALDLLADLDGPADLVLCDPPYGLRRDGGAEAARVNRLYRRHQHSNVVGGYVDVDPDDYEQFTFSWVQAAARVLRPGGQLAVVTGPQQSAIVGYAAMRSGLTWVAKVAAYRAFPVRTSRRLSPAHWDVTIVCNGPLQHPRRVFNVPPDLPKSRQGTDYPLDFWVDNGRSDRRGLIRYDNSLPLRLVRRLVYALSAPAHHVVDPFLGSGTTAIACHQLGRAFTGGDVNPHALRLTAARLLDEHAWHADRAPTLLAPTDPAVGEQSSLFALPDAA